MDMLLPSCTECEFEKNSVIIHAIYTPRYEALTNADNMVLHLINVNLTSQNCQISVKFIVEVLN